MSSDMFMWEKNLSLTDKSIIGGNMKLTFEANLETLRESISCINSDLVAARNQIRHMKDSDFSEVDKEALGYPSKLKYFVELEVLLSSLLKDVMLAYRNNARMYAKSLSVECRDEFCKSHPAVDFSK